MGWLIDAGCLSAEEACRAPPEQRVFMLWQLPGTIPAPASEGRPTRVVSKDDGRNTLSEMLAYSRPSAALWTITVGQSGSEV
jgi:hypothetical protein